MTEVAQIGEYGAMWELVPPHTVESIRADARYAAENRRPFLCRIHHRREVIGTPYMPEDDFFTAALNVIATTDKRALMRCARCGLISERVVF